MKAFFRDPHHTFGFSQLTFAFQFSSAPAIIMMNGCGAQRVNGPLVLFSSESA
jgi:hypothetical protein